MLFLLFSFKWKGAYVRAKSILQLVEENTK